MQNSELLNEILSKIEFKIQADQNVREEYIYRIKKKIYKIFKNERKFINSNTIFKNVTKDDREAINKLSLIDTMSKISVGFLINQICKNLNNDGVYLNIGVWRGFSMFAGMLNTNCEVYGVDNFSFNYEDGNRSLSNTKEEFNTRNYFYKHLQMYQNENKHFFLIQIIKIFLNYGKRRIKL